jgi:hypothetical protein
MAKNHPVLWLDPAAAVTFHLPKPDKRCHLRRADPLLV